MSTPTVRSLFARRSLASPVSPCTPRTSLFSISPAVSSIIVPAVSSSNPSSSPAAAAPSPQWHHHHHHQSRFFHMTPAQTAKSVVPAKGSKGGKQSKGGEGKRGDGKRGKGNKGAEGPDPRILNLKASMPRRVPAPLRFARNRALRHWTIHRAWLLFQNQERVRQAHELERMYQSMHNACEELRKTSGPGLHEEGYLYRVAMEKHGVYGHNAIPIEYARPQTETPARQVWNHEWTR